MKCPKCSAAIPPHALICPHCGDDVPTLRGADGGLSAGAALADGADFGHYRVIRLLGRGGMGEVYEVEHRILRRRYALKLLPADFAERPEALERFQREAEVMANLDHPNIVRVDEFGEHQGRYWLRMELADGVISAGGITDRSLQDVAARQGGCIPPAELAGILRQLLEGLAHAHGRGAVHRDLKPANIMVFAGPDGSPRYKIADFGLVRLVGDDWVRSRAQLTVERSLAMSRMPTAGADVAEGTSTRSLLGTYEYMSPEQKRGESVDARSDVYAIGLIAYRLLTGRQLSPRPPSHYVPGLPGWWDDLLLRALEEKPADRFADAREMLQALPVVEAAFAPLRTQEKPQPVSNTVSLAATGGESRRIWWLALIPLGVAAWFYLAARSPAIRTTTLRADPASIEHPNRIQNDPKEKNEQVVIAGPSQNNEAVTRPESPAAERQQITQWEQARNRSRTGMIDAEKRLQEADRLVREHAYGALADLAGDEILKDLTGKLLASDVHLKGLLVNYGEMHPEVRKARVTRDDLQQKRDDRIAGIRIGLENRYLTEKAKYEEVERLYREARPDEGAKGANAVVDGSADAAARGPRAGLPWTSPTTGQEFVPVEGLDGVLFCKWETRVKDYQLFTNATGRAWEKPPFEQGLTHPAVNVTWDDAVAYCEWLTKMEQEDGKLPAEWHYRLPWDAEWSVAVGLKESQNDTPAEKDSRTPGYPWGLSGKPPANWGNYEMSVSEDGYKYTSPVGVFGPKHGQLCDLGGNVWEWCGDFCNGISGDRVSRGASWSCSSPRLLLSSCRENERPERRLGVFGFRVVLSR